ncbi:MAG TPA: hypothetical protein VIL04_11210 [Solirubrobacterales bacterium]
MATPTLIRSARARSRRAARSVRHAPARAVSLPPVRVELTVDEILDDLAYPARAPRSR